MKDTDFLIIPAFTVTRLGLTGNEQKLYSLIWGFSKDGNNEFTGSINYMMEWLNLSRRTIFYLLDSLVSKNLIKKRETFENGVKFVAYKAVVPELHGECKNCTGSVQKMHLGDAKNAPNSISNNINNNIYKETISKDISKKDIDNLSTEIPFTENPDVENPHVGKDEQLNTDISNTFYHISYKEECEGKKGPHGKTPLEAENMCTKVSPPKTKMSIPTQEEVVEYCNKNNLLVDPYYFFSYYSNQSWRDASGKPVKNWKNKMQTWHAKEAAKRYSSEKKSDSNYNDEANRKIAEKLKKALEWYPWCKSLDDFIVTEQYGEYYLMPHFTEDGRELDRRGIPLDGKPV